MGGTAHRILENPELRSEETADEIKSFFRESPRSGYRHSAQIQRTQNRFIGVECENIVGLFEDGDIILSGKYLNRDFSQSCDQCIGDWTGTEGQSGKIHNEKAIFFLNGKPPTPCVKSDERVSVAEMSEKNMRGRKGRMAAQIDLAGRGEPSEVKSRSRRHEEGGF